MPAESARSHFVSTAWQTVCGDGAAGLVVPVARNAPRGDGPLRKGVGAIRRIPGGALQHAGVWRDSILVSIDLHLHEHDRVLERKAFMLRYRRQIDTERACPIGRKAPVRWNHPVPGLVPPARFIPIDEESGLIVPVGKWILREACRPNKTSQDGCCGTCGLPSISPR